MRLYILIFLLALASCNGGGGGGGSSSEETSTITSYGIWESCENYDANDDSTNDSSLKRVLIIGDDNMTLLRTNHNAINCQPGTQGYRFVNTFSYTQSGSAYSTTLLSESYVPLSDADLAYDNSASWCGINNWVKNQVRDIIGLTCGGETTTAGGYEVINMNRSGNNLNVGVITYTLTADVDLSPAGQTITNGNYIYSDGFSLAIYASFSNGTYDVYRYDLQAITYSREQGTYTSSNNQVTFVATSSLPVGCYVGSATRRFAQGIGGIVMEFEAENIVLIAPKVSDSEALFRSSYLGGTFSVGCI
jgi:hypothetical protein